MLVNRWDCPVLVGRDHWCSRRPRVQDGVPRSIAARELGIPVPIRHGYPDVTAADYDRSDVYRVANPSSSSSSFSTSNAINTPGSSSQVTSMNAAGKGLGEVMPQTHR